MNLNERLLAKIAKLQTMVNRGTDNEKITASKLLENLATKYSIDLDKLQEENTEQYFEFTFKNKYDRKLLLQCMYKTLGSNTDKNIATYTPYRSRTKVGVYCTKAQRVEILLDYEFYSNYLEDDLMGFVHSFIQANSIFPENNDIQYIDIDKIDDETRKMLHMSTMIATRTRHMQLENKEDE